MAEMTCEKALEVLNKLGGKGFPDAESRDAIYLATGVLGDIVRRRSEAYLKAMRNERIQTPLRALYQCLRDPFGWEEEDCDTFMRKVRQMIAEEEAKNGR